MSQGDGASSAPGGRITRSNTNTHLSEISTQMVEEGEKNAPVEGSLVLGLAGVKRRRQSTGKGKAPASDEQDDEMGASDDEEDVERTLQPGEFSPQVAADFDKMKVPPCHSTVSALVFLIVSLTF